MTVAGTGLLLRQALRRDRVLAPVWMAVLVLTTYASAAATGSLFSTPQQQVQLAQQLNAQPALVALYGPILDVTSAGELAMSKMTVLYAVFAAILFVVLVRRHTRVEEESGRAELVGATAVGRDAPMAAAVGEGVALAVALGVLVALADIAGGLPAAGSLWFGVIWAGTGLVATGTAALACQLSASARTCAAIAAGLLGGAYVARAAGDAASGLDWLSWLSPFGWNTRLRAWSDPRPWVVLLYVGLAVVLVGAAQVLRGRRDLAAGLIAARPGPVDGRLGGPFALGLRVHRAMLVIWSVAVLGQGVLFGAIAPGLDTTLTSLGGGQELLDRLGGALIGAVLSVDAIAITCFGVTVVGHAGGDEGAGRAELVLATAASRARWLASTSVTALAGSAWLLVVTGVGLWIGYGAAGGHEPAKALLGALAWIPAVWLVTALALLGFAVDARGSVVGWVLVVLFLTLTLIGELLDFPRWLINLSPYSAVPQYPGAAWDWTPEIVLTAVAAAACAAAWWRFARRDIG